MTTNEIIKAMISDGATIVCLRFRKEIWELIKKDGGRVRLRSNSANAVIRSSSFKVIEQTASSTTWAYRPKN
jgi:hypothetical protein